MPDGPDHGVADDAHGPAVAHVPLLVKGSVVVDPGDGLQASPSRTSRRMADTGKHALPAGERAPRAQPASAARTNHDATLIVILLSS